MLVARAATVVVLESKWAVQFAMLDVRVLTMRSKAQRRLVGLTAKVTSLRIDLDTARADLGLHIAEMRALEAVVKETKEKIVTTVDGVEESVATARTDLGRRVTGGRDLKTALKEKDESVVDIRANAALMIPNMQVVFASGPSA